MKQRGRKSAAQLSVAAVTDLTQIPPPPEHITEVQGEVWRMVMASDAGTMIHTEAYPVLVEYCRSIEKADMLAKQIEKFDPNWIADDEGLRRYDKLLSMQDRLSRTITSLGVKLRITPSTRYQANTAARKVGTAGSGRKPWDRD